MPPRKVVNPVTGRKVLAKGSVGKKVINHFGPLPRGSCRPGSRKTRSGNCVRSTKNVRPHTLRACPQLVHRGKKCVTIRRRTIRHKLPPCPIGKRHYGKSLTCKRYRYKPHKPPKTKQCPGMRHFGKSKCLPFKRRTLAQLLTHIYP